MTGRGAFTVVAAVLAAFLLFTTVVRPAVERGGALELGLVVAAVATVLLAERWMRGR